MNPTDDRRSHRSSTVALASFVLNVVLFALLAGDSPPRMADAPSIDFESVPSCPADDWYFAVAGGQNCVKGIPPQLGRSLIPDRAAGWFQLETAS